MQIDFHAIETMDFTCSILTPGPVHEPKTPAPHGNAQTSIPQNSDNPHKPTLTIPPMSHDTGRMPETRFPSAILLAMALLSGCAPDASDQLAGTDGPRRPIRQIHPHDLPMFDGSSGEAVNWDELMTRVTESDVIMIGENHDDPEAHAFQLAVINASLDIDPDTVICLEMLERNEQAIIDEWMSGTINTEEFIQQTSSANWGGKGSWDFFYQPMLDAARNRGGSIQAANAPRPLVTSARVEGFESIRALSDEERTHVEIPTVLEGSAYYDRFAREMRENHEERGFEISDEQIANVFRAQATWDATMARSVDEALESSPARAILIIGRFHTDFDGGTILEFQARRPKARILAVSCVPSQDMTFDEKDRDRADIIVLTEAPPEESDDQ